MEEPRPSAPDPVPVHHVEVRRRESSAPSPVHAISNTRFALAFGVAALSDMVSVVTEIVPPVQWIIDIVTAALLFVLLGKKWQILPGLVAEAVPGLAAFPFWVLVVGAVFMMRPKGQSPDSREDAGTSA